MYMNNSPEAATSPPENPQKQKEAVTPLSPEERGKQDGAAKGRVDKQKENEKKEQGERDQELPKIEEQIDQMDTDDENNEGSTEDEKVLKEDLIAAETYAREARETLKDPDEKEIFDIAMNTLSDREKVGIYRCTMTWQKACDGQRKSTALSAKEMHTLRTELFAERMTYEMFHSFDMKMADGLRQARSAIRAEYLLNVDQEDRRCAIEGKEKVRSAILEHLEKNPTLKAKMFANARRQEAEFNAGAQDEKVWGVNGSAMQRLKSENENSKNAAEEMETLLTKLNEGEDKHGLQFELLPASEHDQKTGEILSVRITAQDPNVAKNMQEEVQKLLIQSWREGDEKNAPAKTVILGNAQVIKESVTKLALEEIDGKKLGRKNKV